MNDQDYDGGFLISQTGKLGQITNGTRIQEQQSFSMEKVNDAMNGSDNDNFNDNKRKMVNGDDGSKLV